MPSASGWSRPKGPTRLGPSRSWIQAESRRSSSVNIATATMMTVKTTTTLIAEAITKPVGESAPISCVACMAYTPAVSLMGSLTSAPREPTTS